MLAKAGRPKRDMPGMRWPLVVAPGRSHRPGPLASRGRLVRSATIAPASIRVSSSTSAAHLGRGRRRLCPAGPSLVQRRVANQAMTRRDRRGARRTREPCDRRMFEIPTYADSLVPRWRTGSRAWRPGRCTADRAHRPPCASYDACMPPSPSTYRRLGPVLHRVHDAKADGVGSSPRPVRKACICGFNAHRLGLASRAQGRRMVRRGPRRSRSRPSIMTPWLLRLDDELAPFAKVTDPDVGWRNEVGADPSRTRDFSRHRSWPRRSERANPASSHRRPLGPA